MPGTAGKTDCIMGEGVSEQAGSRGNVWPAVFSHCLWDELQKNESGRGRHGPAKKGTDPI